MKTFGIAIGSIAFIVFIILVMLIIKIDVADIMFSILSGSFVAFFAALLGLFKNISSSRVLTLVFLSIVSAAFSWFIARFFLMILTISLYSTTALAFDLTIGIIGSIAMSAVLIEYNCRTAQSKMTQQVNPSD